MSTLESARLTTDPSGEAPAASAVSPARAAKLTAATAVGWGDDPTKVRGPVSAAWREGTLTRAMELEFLSTWVGIGHPRPGTEILLNAVRFHLEAARQAARVEPLDPHKLLHLPRAGSLRERAMSNLDAAEAHLLNLAPPDYVLGQLPGLLRHVPAHLRARRPATARSWNGSPAARLSPIPTTRPAARRPRAVRGAAADRRRRTRQDRHRDARGQLGRAAGAGLRLRSFRNVIVATTVVHDAAGRSAWPSSAAQPDPRPPVLRARGGRRRRSSSARPSSRPLPAPRGDRGVGREHARRTSTTRQADGGQARRPPGRRARSG